MECKLYNAMSWKARRNFTSRKFRYGKEKEYKPHGVLVRNFCNKFGMTAEEVYEQLRKERNYLLKQLGV